MNVRWSKAGTRHRKEGLENQDVVLQGSTGRFEVVALADGVSSCREAKKGAEIACGAILDLLLQKGEYFWKFEQKKRAELIVEHVFYKLKEAAEKNGVAVEELSSTLAAVLLDKQTKQLLYFNLGDGMLLAVRPECCKILFVPADSAEGCPVTTTRGAASVVQTEVLDASALQSVVLCSDGAWQLMFKQGRLKAECAGLLQGASFTQLGQYLDEQEGMDDYSFIVMEIN